MIADTMNGRFVTRARAFAGASELHPMRENLWTVCLFSALGMILTLLVLMLDRSGEVAHALSLAG